MTVRLQEWIHGMEVGAGSRIVLRILVVCAMVALAVFYNLMVFRGLTSREGMELAQVGRRVAEGAGFSTGCIRPLSLSLVYHRGLRALEGAPSSQVGTNGVAGAADPLNPEEAAWLGRLQGRHPDLVHPPVYPLLLGGVLALNPFGYPDTTQLETFGIYTPDLWIAMLNQALLFAAAGLLYSLGRRLFEPAVGWVAALLLVGSELLWRFTASGAPTLLLMVILLLILHALASLDHAARDSTPSGPRLIRLALLLGFLTGLGMMTRYSFGWLIVPVGLVVATRPTRQRAGLIAVMSVVFVLMAAPWLIRNYSLCGQPLGVAGYALFEGTASFPADDLARSTAPDFREFTLGDLARKGVANMSFILRVGLPTLGGSWVTAFFLVGLLLPFRNPSLGALRFFVVLGLILMAVVQALGCPPSPAAELPGGVNVHDLLVLFAPPVFLFGTGLFFILIDQARSAGGTFRITAAGAFCVLLALPLVLRFLPQQGGREESPFPAYYPPWIQDKAAFIDNGDAVMTDIPWAWAWYGGGEAVWMTRYFQDPETVQYRNDFQEIHGRIRPVSGLYLSNRSLDRLKARTLWDYWMGQAEGAEEGWEKYLREWDAFLLIGIYMKNEIPLGFPLKIAPRGIFPELFLIDSERIPENAIQ